MLEKVIQPGQFFNGVVHIPAKNHGFFDGLEILVGGHLEIEAAINRQQRAFDPCQVILRVEGEETPEPGRNEG